MAAKSKARPPRKAQSKEAQSKDTRSRIALAATWQMEGIFDALIKLSRDLEGADNMDDIAPMRALALRGKELNSSAMSMLGDVLVPIEGALAVITGAEAKNG